MRELAIFMTTDLIENLAGLVEQAEELISFNLQLAESFTAR